MSNSVYPRDSRWFPQNTGCKKTKNLPPIVPSRHVNQTARIQKGYSAHSMAPSVVYPAPQSDYSYYPSPYGQYPGGPSIDIHGNSPLSKPRPASGAVQRAKVPPKPRDARLERAPTHKSMAASIYGLEPPPPPPAHYYPQQQSNFGMLGVPPPSAPPTSKKRHCSYIGPSTDVARNDRPLPRLPTEKALPPLPDNTLNRRQAVRRRG